MKKLQYLGFQVAIEMRRLVKASYVTIFFSCDFLQHTCLSSFPACHFPRAFSSLSRLCAPVEARSSAHFAEDLALFDFALSAEEMAAEERGSVRITMMLVAITAPLARGGAAAALAATATLMLALVLLCALCCSYAFTLLCFRRHDFGVSGVGFRASGFGRRVPGFLISGF